jgi:hypothetical protein
MAATLQRAYIAPLCSSLSSFREANASRVTVTDGKQKIETGYQAHKQAPRFGRLGDLLGRVLINPPLPSQALRCPLSGGKQS